MTKDFQHSNISYSSQVIEHKYSKNIHILSNPYLLTMINDLSSPKTVQPQINYYVNNIYKYLMTEVINRYFPREEISVDTRMKTFTEAGTYQGESLVKNTPVVCVDLARAGILPTQVCFDMLNYMLNPEGIRQDHVYINRKVNDKEEVIGVDFSGSKIGGDKENAIVIFPDPMGATGGSLAFAVDHYKNKVKGKAKKIVALHMVITPEYIKTIMKEHPDIVVIAARLDRGLSSKKVLNSIPGTFLDEEKALTDKHYIVPGLGGVGEIINNSFV